MVELKACKKCRWWKPDAFLTFVGECEKRGILKNEAEGLCEHFVEEVESEFMYCSDCRETFHKSEMELHRGHIVHKGAHVDEDAHEYIWAGD